MPTNETIDRDDPLCAIVIRLAVDLQASLRDISKFPDSKRRKFHDLIEEHKDDGIFSDYYGVRDARFIRNDIAHEITPLTRAKLMRAKLSFEHALIDVLPRCSPELQRRLAEKMERPPSIGQSNSPAPPKSDCFYYILSRGTNLAVDVPGAEREKNIPVHLWAVPGWIDNQLWKFTRVSENHYAIRSKSSQKCLDVAGSSCANGASVLQYDCADGENQQWQLEPSSDGFYRLTVRHSQARLDRDDCGFGSGTKLQVWEQNGWRNQDWDLVREDHLLSGQHFLVDSTCSASEELGREEAELSLLFGLLAELSRRRATFHCWFSKGQFPRSDFHLRPLMEEFPKEFSQLPSGVEITRALTIAAAANPGATIITSENLVASISQQRPTLRSRTILTSNQDGELALPSLDLQVKHHGAAGSERIANRLTPAWTEWAKTHEEWKPISRNQPLPQESIIGGNEADGSPLHICRAFHNGTVHPGKVVHGMCNIGYGGRELCVREFEVPVLQNGEWGKPDPGSASALIGGQEDGNALMVCRASFAGGKHIGKVVGLYCNFGFNGKEERSDDFEVYRIPRD